MTLSPDDLAAMDERHRASVVQLAGRDVCVGCHQFWPCDAHRLLVAQEASEAVRKENGYMALALQTDVANLEQKLKRLKDQYNTLVRNRGSRIKHLEETLREITAFPRPWIARDVDAIQSIIDAALNYPPMITGMPGGKEAYERQMMQGQVVPLDAGDEEEERRVVAEPVSPDEWGPDHPI